MTQLEIAGVAMTLAATWGNHLRTQHILDKVIKVTVPPLTATNQPARPLS